jgi:hypothetical protein
MTIEYIYRMGLDSDLSQAVCAVTNTPVSGDCQRHAVVAPAHHHTPCYTVHMFHNRRRSNATLFSICAAPNIPAKCTCQRQPAHRHTPCSHPPAAAPHPLLLLLPRWLPLRAAGPQSTRGPSPPRSCSGVRDRMTAGGPAGLLLLHRLSQSGGTRRAPCSTCGGMQA